MYIYIYVAIYPCGYAEEKNFSCEVIMQKKIVAADATSSLDIFFTATILPRPICNYISILLCAKGLQWSAVVDVTEMRHHT